MKKWISGMHMKKGALTATAKSKGMSVAQLCSMPKSKMSTKTQRRCNLRKTLMGFH